MKIAIAYPPLDNRKGCPTLGQNRQFQFFKEPTYIYPLVPASAATLLKQAGHQAIWLDGIAEGLSYPAFLEVIRREQPDLIAMETKTPVVQQHWKIIEDIKGLFPQMANPKQTQGTVPKVVLFGDHVTALPEESLHNSQVDFVITGGDYDFLLLSLCNAIKNSRFTELEPGIWYRDNRQTKNSGPFKLNHNLDSLPFIDRDLTRWRLYAHKNGNYKRTPGTYIMSGRDCWYHACSFCSWPTLYPEFRARNPQGVLDEMGVLIDKYGVREIMDDTGTLPAGGWLKEFCAGMVERGYNKKIFLDCNMRFGALSAQDFSLIKKANFRLLLFGLESANQDTLDRLNKGLKVDQVISDCRQARKAGLYPHITIMFGYPWEKYEDALKTLELGKRLLTKGYAYTMQATMVIPYPGTPLFRECQKNGWLKSMNWEDYDMKQPVMQVPMSDAQLKDLVRRMYAVSFSPGFLFKKALSIRDIDDLRYALRAAKKVAGHIFDFRQERVCSGR